MKLTRIILSIVLVLFAATAQAAKTPKVDICHFDADAGILVPLSVNGNSVEKHIVNHGDQYPDGLTLDEECMIIIAPPAILARAFIDADPTDGGYNVDIDPDIAILFDSDGTPGLSVGDTVRLVEYPLSFDPCPTPTTCETGTSSLANVDLVVPGFDVYDGGQRIILRMNSSGGAIVFGSVSSYEQFTASTSNTTAGIHIRLIDRLTSFNADWLGCESSVDATCSDPLLYSSNFSPVDDAFFDIEIY
ncbi:MAG: hypothetical protein OQJ84_01125 [Xanthomonadales bacterium]|nr:hypothetical protein [Xanthomonadales bacterium]